MRRYRRKRTAAGVSANLMLAPAVALMRLPLIAAEAGSANPWRGEAMRAVSEKAVAMVDGVVAAQMSMLGAAASFWPDVLAGKTPAMLSGAAVERSVSAALKPAGLRVRQNFKRLSKV